MRHFLPAYMKDVRAPLDWTVEIVALLVHAVRRQIVAQDVAQFRVVLRPTRALQKPVDHFPRDGALPQVLLERWFVRLVRCQGRQAAASHDKRSPSRPRVNALHGHSFLSRFVCLPIHSLLPPWPPIGTRSQPPACRRVPCDAVVRGSWPWIAYSGCVGSCVGGVLPRRVRQGDLGRIASGGQAVQADPVGIQCQARCSSRTWPRDRRRRRRQAAAW